MIICKRSSIYIMAKVHSYFRRGVIFCALPNQTWMSVGSNMAHLKPSKPLIHGSAGLILVGWGGGMILWSFFHQIRPWSCWLKNKACKIKGMEYLKTTLPYPKHLLYDVTKAYHFGSLSPCFLSCQSIRLDQYNIIFSYGAFLNICIRKSENTE